MYDHIDLEDFRTDVERALTFSEAAEVHAPAMQPPENPKSEGPDAFAFARNVGAFRWSGRLDLNQRPLAPQRRSLNVQSVVRSRKPLQRLAMTRVAIPRFRRVSPDFAEVLLLVCCWSSGAASSS